MKILASLCVLLSFLGLNEINHSPKWNTNLEEALIQTKKNKKSVLVYFTGSDWCGPCQALKKDFFESEKFVQKANEFNLVIIDIPLRMDTLSPEQLEYNKEKLSQLNPQKKFPTLIALSAKGKEINRINGYSAQGSPDAYFTFLEEVLE